MVIFIQRAPRFILDLTMYDLRSLGQNVRRHKKLNVILKGQVESHLKRQ